MPALPESLALTLLWGDVATGSVLATAYLDPGATFTLGEDAACDALVPAEALGAPVLTIASWDAGVPRVHVPQSGRVIAVEPDVPVEIAFGAFTMTARRVPALVHDRADVRGRSSRDGLGSIAASFALHALLFALFATRARTLAATTEARFEHDALTTRSHLLAASAQHESDAAHTLAAIGDVSRAVHSAVESVRHAEAQPPPPPPAPATSPSGPAPPTATTKLPFVPLSVPLTVRPTTKSEEDLFVEAIQAQIKEMDPLAFGHVHGEHRPGPTLGHPDEFPSRRVPESVIASVVKANAGRIQVCLAIGTRRDPALSGEVDVSFVIGATGAVLEAHDAGGELADADVRRCLVRTFAQLSFPPPPLGTQSVTFPVEIAAREP